MLNINGQIRQVEPLTKRQKTGQEVSFRILYHDNETPSIHLKKLVTKS